MQLDHFICTAQVFFWFVGKHAVVTDQQAAGPRQVADWNQLEGWWMQTDLFSGAAERDVSEGGGGSQPWCLYIYIQQH